MALPLDAMACDRVNKMKSLYLLAWIPTRPALIPCLMGEGLVGQGAPIRRLRDRLWSLLFAPTIAGSTWLGVTAPHRRAMTDVAGARKPPRHGRTA